MNDFELLKRRFSQAGEKDVQMRSSIRLALADLNGYVGDITLKRSLVVLTAVNKSAASELFLRLDEIKRQLPEWVMGVEVR